jgi:hypothetical protein
LGAAENEATKGKKRHRGGGRRRQHQGGRGASGRVVEMRGGMQLLAGISTFFKGNFLLSLYLIPEFCRWG